METEDIKIYRAYVERSSWFLVFLGILSQLNAHYSFPSYNVALGFWGVYCSISKHGRATLGLTIFLTMALLMDVIYSVSNEGHTSGYRFALAMVILCLFLKIYILYYGSKFFAALGGHYSLELDSSVMDESGYSSMGTSGTMGGGYYPPVDASHTSDEHLKTSGTKLSLPLILLYSVLSVL